MRECSKKAPHHAGDGDVLRVAGDAGPQAADAADDEIDPNPCTRGLGQLFHDIVVGEGVHLHDDAAVAAPGGLFPDEQEDDLLQVGGGDQEVVVAASRLPTAMFLKNSAASRPMPDPR